MLIMWYHLKGEMCKRLIFFSSSLIFWSMKVNMISAFGEKWLPWSYRCHIMFLDLGQFVRGLKVNCSFKVAHCCPGHRLKVWLWLVETCCFITVSVSEKSSSDVNCLSLCAFMFVLHSCSIRRSHLRQAYSIVFSCNGGHQLSEICSNK